MPDHHVADRRPLSGTVTAAGVEHVRLAYFYRDMGDADGYGSLFHPTAGTGLPEPSGGPAQHRLDRIVADGNTVMVAGRVVAPLSVGAGPDVAFVDVFTLTDDGVLLDSHRYHRTARS